MITNPTLNTSKVSALFRDFIQVIATCAGKLENRVLMALALPAMIRSAVWVTQNPQSPFSTDLLKEADNRCLP
jgi:hypothetical protein